MNDKSKSDIMKVVKLWSQYKPNHSSIDMYNIEFEHEAARRMHLIMHDVLVDIADGCGVVVALQRALMYAREFRDKYEADHWLELHCGEIGYATFAEFENMSAVRNKTYSMYKEFATAIFEMIRDVETEDES